MNKHVLRTTDMAGLSSVKRHRGEPDVGEITEKDIDTLTARLDLGRLNMYSTRVNTKG